jgi:hypothetical protein
MKRVMRRHDFGSGREATRSEYRKYSQGERQSRCGVASNDEAVGTCSALRGTLREALNNPAFVTPVKTGVQ